MPRTNGLGKSGPKRRIVSDDEDLEEQGPAPVVTQSQNDLTKLIKQEAPFEPPEESSSDEEPIRYLVF